MYFIVSYLCKLYLFHLALSLVTWLASRASSRSQNIVFDIKQAMKKTTTVTKKYKVLTY